MYRGIGMKIFHHVALATCVAGVSFGCGVLDTKSKGQKATQNDSDLAGKWNSGCAANDWFGLSHNRESLTFNVLGDYDRTITVFNDESCDEASATMSESGTFQTLGRSSAAPEGSNINFTLLKIHVTPHTDESVAALNTLSFCGKSNWQKGVEADVLGKECMGRTYSTGEVVFDIYRLSDKNSKLHLGKGTLWVDKTQSDSRPTEFDSNRAFTKE